MTDQPNVINLTHIQMIEADYTGKTKVWTVFAKEGGFRLGDIGWFGRWRGYVFRPGANTVYEQKCLREIADFIETRTREHRQAKAGR